MDHDNDRKCLHCEANMDDVQNKHNEKLHLAKMCQETYTKCWH